MIDLRAGLGAPPIVFPGVQMQHHPETPNVVTNAPTMTPGQAAQRRGLAGCVGCPPGVAQPVALAGGGIGDLQSRWDKIPLWAKIVGGTVLFSGVAYGTYRLTYRLAR